MSLSVSRLSQLALAVGLFAIVLPTNSQAQGELITNGNFETGDFTGFTLANQANPSDNANANHFYISAPGSNTPAVNGVTFTTSPNPTGGNFYAVSTADLPGAHALLQNFTVPANQGIVHLSFQMFVNDQSGIGPIVDPSGLDYTTGGLAQPNDNQHARVDILRAGAGDLSTAPADVIDNLYLSVDPSSFDANSNLIPNAFNTYTADLTGVLTPGSSYRIRFAEVDNNSAINMGVDNISLVASTPEPGTLALVAGLGLSGTMLTLRRRRAAQARA
jgi:hypothetical protein